MTPLKAPMMKRLTRPSGAQIERSIDGKLAVRDRAIIALLTGSGLRASELCSLTIRQWHGRQNGHVYVKRKGGAMR